MNFGTFFENFHVVKGLSIAADRYNTNPNTDIINMKNFSRVAFLLNQVTAGSNTGTATAKVYGCTNVAGSNAEVVPFKWAKMTTGVSDAMGTLATAVAATGVTTTANEDTIFVFDVDSRDLPDDKPCVYLNLTEVVNDPVTAMVMAILYNPKIEGQPFATALT